MIKSRRYDLDWLRVIAFFILIYFHTAVFFIPGGIPQIQNDEVSDGLLVFVDISHQFRLALLFLISGVGVAFAKRHRDSRAFMTERSKRLLIPLAIGILFIVPPMVYTEKVFTGEVTSSFFAFYPTVFTSGVYPAGNLSWHHFWFIVYLYLFCLLGLQVFNRLAAANEVTHAKLVSDFSGAGVYKFIAVLLVPEVMLRWIFPGFQDLIHDWANFVHWFLIFIAGYFIANHEKLLDDVVRFRLLSLMGAAGSVGLLYLILGGVDPSLHAGDANVVEKYLLWCVLRITMIWCCILSCLGYAGRYLRHSNPVLSYLNEAVYPLFILHLTIITVLGYFVVQFDWNLWVKYLFITSTTVTMVLAIYQWLIRPFNLTRLLFGVKPKSEAAQIRAKRVLTV